MLSGAEKQKIIEVEELRYNIKERVKSEYKAKEMLIGLIAVIMLVAAVCIGAYFYYVY
jgi:hypothetical protein